MHNPPIPVEGSALVPLANTSTSQVGDSLPSITHAHAGGGAGAMPQLPSVLQASEPLQVKMRTRQGQVLQPVLPPYMSVTLLSGHRFEDPAGTILAAMRALERAPCTRHDTDAETVRLSYDVVLDEPDLGVRGRLQVVLTVDREGKRLQEAAVTFGEGPDTHYVRVTFGEAPVAHATVDASSAAALSTTTAQALFLPDCAWARTHLPQWRARYCPPQDTPGSAASASAALSAAAKHPAKDAISLPPGDTALAQRLSCVRSLAQAAGRCRTALEALPPQALPAYAQDEALSLWHWYADQLKAAHEEAAALTGGSAQTHQTLTALLAQAQADTAAIAALLDGVMPSVSPGAIPEADAGLRATMTALSQCFEQYWFQAKPLAALSVTGPAAKAAASGNLPAPVAWYDAAHAAGFLNAAEVRFWRLCAGEGNAAASWLPQELDGEQADAMRFALHLHLKTGMALENLLRLRFGDLVSRREEWVLDDKDNGSYRIWSLRVPDKLLQPQYLDIELDARDMELLWPLLTRFVDGPDALLLADGDGKLPDIAALRAHVAAARQANPQSADQALPADTAVDAEVVQAIKEYVLPAKVGNAWLGNKLKTMRKRAVENQGAYTSRKGRTLLNQAKRRPDLMLYAGPGNIVECRTVINGVHFGFRVQVQRRDAPCGTDEESAMEIDGQEGNADALVGGFALSRLHCYALPPVVLTRTEDSHRDALAQAKAAIQWPYNTQDLLLLAINPGQGRVIAGRPGWFRYRSTVGDHVLDIEARVHSGQIREIGRIAVHALPAPAIEGDPDAPVQCDTLAQSYAGARLLPEYVRYEARPAWRRPEIATVDAGDLAAPQADMDETDNIPEPALIMAPQNSIARKIGDLPYTRRDRQEQSSSGPVLDCGFNALLMNIPRLQDACRQHEDGAHCPAVLNELARRVRDYSQQQPGSEAVGPSGLSNYLVTDLLDEDDIHAQTINYSVRRNMEDFGAMLDASHQAAENLLLHTIGDSHYVMLGTHAIAGHHFVTLVPVPGGWRLHDPMHPSQQPLITRHQLLALRDERDTDLFSIPKPGQNSAVRQWRRSQKQAANTQNAAMAERVASLRNASPSAASPVLAYYLHPASVPPGEGDLAVCLEAHRRQTHAQLESNHRYIQRLFPTDKQSGVWPQAPTLTADDIAAFHADPALRAELIKSLKTMLAFYHLELKESASPMRIVPRDGFDPDKAGWFGTTQTRFNHNYQRLSRILCSLRLLGCQPYAHALMACLDQLYAQYTDRIAADSYDIWKEAAAGTGRFARGATASKVRKDGISGSSGTNDAQRYRFVTGVSYVADPDRKINQKVAPKILLQELAAYLSNGKSRDPAPLLDRLLQQQRPGDGVCRVLLTVPGQRHGRAIPALLKNGLERHEGSRCLPLEMLIDGRKIRRVRIAGVRDFMQGEQPPVRAWQQARDVRYRGVGDNRLAPEDIEFRLRELSAVLCGHVDWVRLLDPLLQRQPQKSGWYAVSLPYPLPAHGVSSGLGHTLRSQGQQAALDLVVHLDVQARQVTEVCLCDNRKQAQAVREQLEDEAGDTDSVASDGMEIDTGKAIDTGGGELNDLEFEIVLDTMKTRTDAYLNQQYARGEAPQFEEIERIAKETEQEVIACLAEAEQEIQRIAQQQPQTGQLLSDAYRKAAHEASGITNEAELTLQRVAWLEEQWRFAQLQPLLLARINGRELDDEEEDAAQAEIQRLGNEIANELATLAKTGEPVPSLDWIDLESGPEQLLAYADENPQATPEELTHYADSIARHAAQEHGRLMQAERKYFLEERWRVDKAVTALSRQQYNDPLRSPYFRLLARRSALQRRCEQREAQYQALIDEDPAMAQDEEEPDFPQALDNSWAADRRVLLMEVKFSWEAAKRLRREVDAHIPAARLQWQLEHERQLTPEDKVARLRKAIEKSLGKLRGQRYAKLPDLMLDCLRRKWALPTQHAAMQKQPAVRAWPDKPQPEAGGLMLDAYLPAIIAHDLDETGGNAALDALARATTQPVEAYLAGRLRPQHEAPDADDPLPSYLRRFTSGADDPPFLLVRTAGNIVTDVRIDTAENRRQLASYRLHASRLRVILNLDRRVHGGALVHLAGGYTEAGPWLEEIVRPGNGEVIDAAVPQVMRFATGQKDGQGRDIALLACIEDGEIVDVRPCGMGAFLSMAFGRRTAGSGVAGVWQALRGGGCTEPLAAVLRTLVQSGEGEAVDDTYPSVRRYRTGYFDAQQNEIVVLVRMRHGRPCAVCLDTPEDWEAMAGYVLSAFSQNLITRSDISSGSPLSRFAGGTAALTKLLGKHVAYGMGKPVPMTDGEDGVPPTDAAAPPTLQRYTLIGDGGREMDVLAEVVDGEIVDVRPYKAPNRRQMAANARQHIDERRQRLEQRGVDWLLQRMQSNRGGFKHQSAYDHDRQQGQALIGLARASGLGFADYIDAAAANEEGAVTVDDRWNIRSHLCGQGQARDGDALRLLVRRDADGNIVDARLHTAKNLELMRKLAARQERDGRQATWVRRLLHNDFYRGRPVMLLARRKKQSFPTFIREEILKQPGTLAAELPDGDTVKRYRTSLEDHGRHIELLARFDQENRLVDCWRDFAKEHAERGQLDLELRAACRYLEAGLPVRPDLDGGGDAMDVDDDIALPDTHTLSDGDLRTIVQELLDDLANAPLMKKFGGYLEYLRGELDLDDFADALRVCLMGTITPGNEVALPDGRQAYPLPLRDAAGNPLYLVPQIEGNAIKRVELAVGASRHRRRDDLAACIPDPRTWDDIADAFYGDVNSIPFFLAAMPEAVGDTGYDFSAALKGWVVLKVQPHLALPTIVGDPRGYRRYATGLTDPISGQDIHFLACSEGGKLAGLRIAVGSGALLLDAAVRDRLAAEIWAGAGQARGPSLERHRELAVFKDAVMRQGGASMYDLQNNLRQLMEDMIRPELGFQSPDDPDGYLRYRSGIDDPADGRPFLFQVRHEDGRIVDARLFKGDLPGDEAAMDSEEIDAAAQDEELFAPDPELDKILAAAAGMTEDEREAANRFFDAIEHGDRRALRGGDDVLLENVLKQAGMDDSVEGILSILAPDEAIRQEALAAVAAQETGDESEDGLEPWEMARWYLAACSGAQAPFRDEDLQAIAERMQASHVHPAQLAAAVLKECGQQAAVFDLGKLARDAEAGTGLSWKELRPILEGNAGTRQVMAYWHEDGSEQDAWMRQRRGDQGQWMVLDGGGKGRQRPCGVTRCLKRLVGKEQQQQDSGKTGGGMRLPVLMAPDANDPLVKLMHAQGAHFVQARQALGALFGITLHPLGLVQDAMRQFEPENSGHLARLSFELRTDLFERSHLDLLQGYLQAALGKDAVEKYGINLCAKAAPSQEAQDNGEIAIEQDDGVYRALAPDAQLGLLALPSGMEPGFAALRRIGERWHVIEGKDGLPSGQDTGPTLQAWLAERCRAREIALELAHGEGADKPDPVALRRGKQALRRALDKLPFIAMRTDDVALAARTLKNHDQGCVDDALMRAKAGEKNREGTPPDVGDGIAGIEEASTIGEAHDETAPASGRMRCGNAKPLWDKLPQKQRNAMKPILHHWMALHGSRGTTVDQRTAGNLLDGVASLCDMQKRNDVWDDEADTKFPDIHRFVLNTADWNEDGAAGKPGIEFEIAAWHRPDAKGAEELLDFRLLRVGGQPCDPPKKNTTTWIAHLRSTGPQAEWIKRHGVKQGPASPLRLDRARARHLAEKQSVDYRQLLVLYRSAAPENHYATTEHVLIDIAENLCGNNNALALDKVHDEDGRAIDCPGFVEYAIHNAWETDRNFRVYVMQENGNVLDIRLAEKIGTYLGGEGETQCEIVQEMQAALGKSRGGNKKKLRHAEFYEKMKLKPQDVYLKMIAGSSHKGIVIFQTDDTVYTRTSTGTAEGKARKSHHFAPKDKFEDGVVFAQGQALPPWKGSVARYTDHTAFYQKMQLDPKNFKFQQFSKSGGEGVVVCETDTHVYFESMTSAKRGNKSNSYYQASKDQFEDGTVFEVGKELPPLKEAAATSRKRRLDHTAHTAFYKTMMLDPKNVKFQQFAHCGGEGVVVCETNTHVYFESMTSAKRGNKSNSYYHAPKDKFEDGTVFEVGKELPPLKGAAATSRKPRVDHTTFYKTMMLDPKNVTFQQFAHCGGEGVVVCETDTHVYFESMTSAKKGNKSNSYYNAPKDKFEDGTVPEAGKALPPLKPGVLKAKKSPQRATPSSRPGTSTSADNAGQAVVLPQPTQDSDIEEQQTDEEMEDVMMEDVMTEDVVMEGTMSSASSSAEESNPDDDDDQSATSSSIASRITPAPYSLADIAALRPPREAPPRISENTSEANDQRSPKAKSVTTKRSAQSKAPTLLSSLFSGGATAFNDPWSRQIQSTQNLKFRPIHTDNLGFPKRVRGIGISRHAYDSLGDGRMVTDEIIRYAYKVFADIHLDAKFIDPAVVLQLGHDTATIGTLGALELGDSAVVLFPVSDKRITYSQGRGDLVRQMSGGTHWVLLAWDRRVADRNAFHYYDSLNRNDDKTPERRTAAAIVAWIDAQTGRDSTFTLQGAPQQGAGSNDCGVFVIEMSRALAQRHAQGDVPFGALTAGSGDGQVRLGKVARADWRQRLEQETGQTNFRPWLDYAKDVQAVLKFRLAELLDYGMLDGGTQRARLGHQDIEIKGAAWETHAKVLLIENDVAYFQPDNVTRGGDGRFVRAHDNAELLRRMQVDREYEQYLKTMIVIGVTLTECPALRDAVPGQAYLLKPVVESRHEGVVATREDKENGADTGKTGGSGRNEPAVWTIPESDDDADDTDKATTARSTEFTLDDLYDEEEVSNDSDDDVMETGAAGGSAEGNANALARTRTTTLMDVLRQAVLAGGDGGDASESVSDSIATEADLVKALGGSDDLMTRLDELWEWDQEDLPPALESAALARLPQRLRLQPKEAESVQSALATMGGSMFELGHAYTSLADSSAAGSTQHDTAFWITPGDGQAPPGMHLVEQHGLRCGLHALHHCVGQQDAGAFTMDLARRIMLRDYIKARLDGRSVMFLAGSALSTEPQKGFLGAIDDAWEEERKKLPAADAPAAAWKQAIGALIKKYDRIGQKQAKEKGEGAAAMAITGPPGVVHMMDDTLANFSLDLLQAMLEEKGPSNLEYRKVNVVHSEGTIAQLREAWRAMLAELAGTGRQPRFAAIHDDKGAHYTAMRLLDGQVYCIDSQGGAGGKPCYSVVPGNDANARLAGFVDHLIRAMHLDNVTDERHMGLVVGVDKAQESTGQATQLTGTSTLPATSAAKRRPSDEKDAPDTAETAQSVNKKQRHLKSDQSWRDLPLDRWKRPDEAALRSLAHSAGGAPPGPKHYSGQYIVQLEPDDAALEAALALVGKHPAHSILLQWKPDERDMHARVRPVIEQKQFDASRLRIVLVGVGRQGNGALHIANQHADALAAKFMLLLKKELKCDLKAERLPSVSIVACSSGPSPDESTASPSYTQLFTQALTPHLVRWVTGYGGRLVVDGGGRKKILGRDDAPRPARDAKSRFAPVEKGSGKDDLMRANRSLAQMDGQALSEASREFDPEQVHGRWIFLRADPKNGDLYFKVVSEHTSQEKNREKPERIVRVSQQQAQTHGLAALPKARGNVFRCEGGRFRHEVAVREL